MNQEQKPSTTEVEKFPETPFCRNSTTQVLTLLGRFNDYI
jgi:hypothetical protein